MIRSRLGRADDAEVALRDVGGTSQSSQIELMVE